MFISAANITGGSSFCKKLLMTHIRKSLSAKISWVQNSQPIFLFTEVQAHTYAVKKQRCLIHLKANAACRDSNRPSLLTTDSGAAPQLLIISKRLQTFPR